MRRIADNKTRLSPPLSTSGEIEKESKVVRMSFMIHLQAMGISKKCKNTHDSRS